METIGIARQNAGIRIYKTQDVENQTLAEKIAGLQKEIPILMNLILYLRGWNKVSIIIHTVGQFNLKAMKIFSTGFVKPPPILFLGTPGTGKTSLIRALANEAKASVIYQFMSVCSDAKQFTSFGFGRTYSPRAIQRRFCEARMKTPTILFLDELDAIGSNRGGYSSLCSPHHKKPLENQNSRIKNGDQRLGLGQLLLEVDNEEKNDGVLLFGATKRPQELDPALTRPGRFYKVVSIPLPDKKKRRAILKLYLKQFSPKSCQIFFSNKTSWETWLARTQGKSPAYLAALRNLTLVHIRNHPTNDSIDYGFKVIWNRL